MNIKEKITKFSNLDVDDSLSSFMGHSAQQNHNVYEIFYNFIKEIKPTRILEIGTALGGFTEFLNIISNELNLNINILTYDISERPWYNEMILKGIDVRVENVFGDNYASVNDEVIDFIQNEGITVVLCDGGWKIGEFNILSNYLKVGDFIMAHDYCENNKIFEEEIYGKIWNWCEIIEDDIKEACSRNNLFPYNQENFSKAVWVCKVKEK